MRRSIVPFAGIAEKIPTLACYSDGPAGLPTKRDSSMIAQ
jgi:hypothetical protein